MGVGCRAQFQAGGVGHALGLWSWQVQHSNHLVMVQCNAMVQHGTV